MSNRGAKVAQALRPIVEGPKLSRTSHLPSTARLQTRSHTTKPTPVPKAIPTRNARKMTTVAPSVEAAVMEELANLKSVFEAIPFTSQGPAEQPPSEFTFPLGTLFKAPTRERGLDMAPAYAQALKEHGVAAIEVDFEDPSSQFILDVVDAINCKPDSHSSTQGALWDVTYKPEGVKSEGTGKSAHSISHSLGEFDWHTDAAFEQSPMRYFGFHILHPDKKDGGVFRLLRAEELANLLSPETVGTLLTYEFDLRVPPEFFKGQDTVKGKLLHFDQSTGQTFVRFRRDILKDPPSNNPAACKAVKELLGLLDDPERVGKSMPQFAFKENTVLLMDNARFLHSRTNIKDPKRHLRRVRFRGNPGTLLGESEY